MAKINYIGGFLQYIVESRTLLKINLFERLQFLLTSQSFKSYFNAENCTNSVQNPNTLERARVYKLISIREAIEQKNLWKVFTENLSDWKAIKKFRQK